MSDKFDFIVVGGLDILKSSHQMLISCCVISSSDRISIGGTAGCLLASRLADAQTRPLVLLIEAGDDPEATELHSIYDRFVPAFTRPELDHGYLTTPQPELNDREIPYPRGKAMGGSSNLNYMGELNV